MATSAKSDARRVRATTRSHVAHALSGVSDLCCTTFESAVQIQKALDRGQRYDHALESLCTSVDGLEKACWVMWCYLRETKTRSRVVLKGKHDSRDFDGDVNLNCALWGSVALIRKKLFALIHSNSLVEKQLSANAIAVSVAALNKETRAGITTFILTTSNPPPSPPPPPKR